MYLHSKVIHNGNWSWIDPRWSPDTESREQAVVWASASEQFEAGNALFDDIFEGINLRLIMTCELNSQSSWKSYQAVLETNISAAHKAHYILSWCASSNPNISSSTSWIQVYKLVHVNIRTRWISIVVSSFSRCQIRSIYSDCSDGNCHCS